jgi:cell wall-associated NlpC family hydrolase
MTVVVIILAVAVSATAAGAHSPGGNRKMRRHIVKRARRQVGTRYVYGGASKSGFDCSGFTMWVFSHSGVSLPHRAIDQFRLAGSGGNKRIHRRGKLRRGDLVFHKTTSAPVGHVGIYTGRGRWVHASSARGRVVKDRLRNYSMPFKGGTRVRTLTRRPS